MSKQEFLYEHDADSVLYLIGEHMRMNGLIGANDYEEEETQSARDFFI
ncbi:hypothetical protein NHG29_01505 [Aerococcaceae bacterium NML160702]|nr:hypothetical protein [Aerococcaceae bacterium NML190073]MCW6681542.1 hypothetical protein [Aerococcaceae bacterium NML160702]